MCRWLQPQDGEIGLNLQLDSDPKCWFVQRKWSSNMNELIYVYWIRIWSWDGVIIYIPILHCSIQYTSAQKTSGNTASATFQKNTHTHTHTHPRAWRQGKCHRAPTTIFLGAELGFWAGSLKGIPKHPVFKQNVGNRMVIGGHGGHFWWSHNV